MIVQSILLDALKNLRSNILRTGLTMLGVIIGVAAVIAMIAIVEGGQIWLVRSIERLGTNLLFVWQRSLNLEEQRQFSGRSLGLRYSDVMALRQQFPGIVVIPEIEIDQQLKAGDRDFSGEVTGTWPEYQEVRNFHVEHGRFLLSSDLSEWKRVVVLGKEVAEELFGSELPLNKEVKIGDHRFTVVGVMEPKGMVRRTNYDEMVFVPITTMMRRFTGNDRIRRMVIHVPDREQMEQVTQHVHSLLIQLHDGVDDIRVRNQGEFLNAVDQTIWTFRIVLGGVAVVALLVGGIGIMNIMLVTVTERTREVGLRKAIGARRRDILLQFLIESVTISAIGGGLGIVGGIAAAYGFGGFVAQSMPGGGDWGAVVQPSAIIIAFSFAVFVGVFFGLYPAVKASKLDPAEALRYQ
ncbi:ABC transporter permease [Candidatus Nitronereus thalassa]|uniref:ABC transporter permease n=1 Tax=Candidatus Nitronereus thalassa TaxID=3020898 RepID=A0ABU3K3G6_9BACT|nr:ABC transporter permease [Candidatus Nitronereus thalassa]MDT7040925.1 ABC transporter permease [Candidatus Nitronereus thalassa]